MKFYKIVLPLSMVVILITLPDKKADAQLMITQVVKQAVSKIIRAIDLEVQQAQNKTIWLQNAQKVVENQLNQLKLSQIAGIGRQQTDLFTKYYNELYTVKEIIADYEQVRNIMLEQEALVREYQSAWRLAQQDKHFSAAELKYISSVYTGILKASVNNLDQLLVLVNSFKTQMTDGRRLELINNTSRHVDENYNDLREFNNQNIILSLERANDENDIQSTKNLYGIN